MAVKLLGPLNEVIHKTAADILDNHLANKIAGVVVTFVNSGVEAVRDITKEEIEANGNGEGNGGSNGDGT